MNRMSINEATKEQLIDIVRQLRHQLKDAKAVTNTATEMKELRDQIIGFQGLLQEKNDEIQALRMQCRMLTEKCASDEAIISTQFKRLEEMQSGSTEGADAKQRLRSANVSGPPMLSAKPIESLNLPDGGPSMVSGNSTILHVRGGDSSAVPLPPNRSEGGVLGVASGNSTPSGAALASLNGQLASLSATLASKNDEVAKLETQVRELLEVNSFYSAIVSQHDKEESVRKNAQLSAADRPARELGLQRRERASLTADTSLKRSELLKRISVLEDQRDRLQRVLKQSEKEKGAFVNDSHALRAELERVSSEMLEVERWQRRREKTMFVGESTIGAAAGIRSDSAITSMSAARQSFTPERIPAVVVSPFFAASDPNLGNFSSGGVRQRSTGHHQGLCYSPLAKKPTSGHGRGSSTGGIETHDSDSSHAGAGGTEHSRKPTATTCEIRRLKPIHIRNPNPQEKVLLHRVNLYEKHVSELEQFEADRQKSFDEMERARADIFATMNNQLENQRRVIHQLRRTNEDLRESSSCASMTVADEGLSVAPTAAETRDIAVSPLTSLVPTDSTTKWEPRQSSQHDRLTEQNTWEENIDALLSEEEKPRLRLQLKAMTERVLLFITAMTDAGQLACATSTFEASLRPSCNGKDAMLAGTETTLPVLTAAPASPLSGTEANVFAQAFKDDRLGVALDTLFHMYGESLSALAQSFDSGISGAVQQNYSVDKGDVGTASMTAILHRQKGTFESFPLQPTTPPPEPLLEPTAATAADVDPSGAQCILDSLFAGATGFTGHLQDEGVHGAEGADANAGELPGAPQGEDTLTTRDRREEAGDDNDDIGDAMLGATRSSDKEAARQAPTKPEPAEATTFTLVRHVANHEVFSSSSSAHSKSRSSLDTQRAPRNEHEHLTPRVDEDEKEDAEHSERVQLPQLPFVQGDRGLSLLGSEGADKLTRPIDLEDVGIHLELYEESGEDNDPKDLEGDVLKEGAHHSLSPEEETELLMQLESALAKESITVPNEAATILGEGGLPQHKGSNAADDRCEHCQGVQLDPSQPREPSHGESDRFCTSAEVPFALHDTSDVDSNGEHASAQSRSPSGSSGHTELFRTEGLGAKPRGPPPVNSFSDDLPEVLYTLEDESSTGEVRRPMPHTDTSPGFELTPTTPLTDVGGSIGNVHQVLAASDCASCVDRSRSPFSFAIAASYVTTDLEAEVIPTGSRTTSAAPTTHTFPPIILTNTPIVGELKDTSNPLPVPSAQEPTDNCVESNSSSDDGGGDFHADFNPFA